MISIIIPCYNGADDLVLSLASLRAQTCQDWECVVVDDGSTQPLDVARDHHPDPRIRWIRLEANRGRGAARQAGLDLARGDYVAWQDADDWSYPDRLRVQIDRLEHHRALDFLGTGIAVADRRERLVGVRNDHPIAPRRLAPLERPPLAHPTLMFRRKVLARFRYGPYRTSEDFDFLGRALREHAFGQIEDVLYCYREDQSQSVAKYWGSTETRLRVAAANARAVPFRAAHAAAGYLARAGAYTSLAYLGQEERVIRARSHPPDARDHAAFEAARARVLAWTPGPTA